MFEINLDKSFLDFVEHVTQKGVFDETCAWLYLDRPFYSDHKVSTLMVKNVGLRGQTTQESFALDRSELRKEKLFTKQRQLTNIGNVHAHVIRGFMDYAQGTRPE